MSSLLPTNLRRVVGGVRTLVVALALGAALGVAVPDGPPAGAATVPQASVGAAPSPAGTGSYWVVASDGGIFSFGGVPFEGSTGALHLNAPIVAMAATPSGRGYWLVASDGGIFAFGDAGFFGSPAGLPAGVRPNTPVVAIVAAPDGGGYWVSTAGGTVYGFGDAAVVGSLGGRHLSAPIVAMVATPDGGGYWLAASDGGVFNFGDAPFAGSAAGVRLSKPIVGIAATSSGAGYWMVATDGGIFTFGDATFRGSTGGIRLNQPILGMAVGHTLNPYPGGGRGYDISFPQCGNPYPGQPFDFAIVGVNDGRAFTRNPCLRSQATWAGSVGSVYINLNAPPSGSSEGLAGPAGSCATDDVGCVAYNYGYNAALDASSSASSAGVVAGVWWLDIETTNTWDVNRSNNALTIKGALDALRAQGVVPGIYSTSLQWSIIAGSYAPGTPIWVATGAGLRTAQAFCNASHGFGGGTIWLTQYGSAGNPYDQDYACTLG